MGFIFFTCLFFGGTFLLSGLYYRTKGKHLLKQLQRMKSEPLTFYHYQHEGKDCYTYQNQFFTIDVQIEAEKTIYKVRMVSDMFQGKNLLEMHYSHVEKAWVKNKAKRSKLSEVVGLTKEEEIGVINDLQDLIIQQQESLHLETKREVAHASNEPRESIYSVVDALKNKEYIFEKELTKEFYSIKGNDRWLISVEKKEATYHFNVMKNAYNKVNVQYNESVGEIEDLTLSQDWMNEVENIDEFVEALRYIIMFHLTKEKERETKTENIIKKFNEPKPKILTIKEKLMELIEEVKQYQDLYTIEEKHLIESIENKVLPRLEEFVLHLGNEQKDQIERMYHAEFERLLKIKQRIVERTEKDFKVQEKLIERYDEEL